MLPECISLSAPRRHVDLDAGWILTWRLMSSPSPLLSRLIESVSVSREWEGKGGCWSTEQQQQQRQRDRGFRDCRKHRGGCAQAQDEKGGAVHMQEGWEGKKRQRGKEKTRLSQHDLQIALSPWRLLSALSSIQSGSPNGGATVWWWVEILAGGGVERGEERMRGCWQKSLPPTACAPAVSAPWGGFHHHYMLLRRLLTAVYLRWHTHQTPAVVNSTSITPKSMPNIYVSFICQCDGKRHFPWFRNKCMWNIFISPWLYIPDNCMLSYILAFFFFYLFISPPVWQCRYMGVDVKQH